jgi:hypothetical protein
VFAIVGLAFAIDALALGERELAIVAAGSFLSLVTALSRTARAST